LPFPEIEPLSYNIVTLQTKLIHIQILLDGQTEKEPKYPLRFIDPKRKADNTGQGLNNEQYGVM
jgi:hypothetical protein